MSKPGQQPKSGARSKPPKKPQRHAPVQTVPPPRAQARLEPFVKVVLAAIAIALVLFLLARAGVLDGLLVRMGWGAAEEPVRSEPAR
jgi:hypothetical protein